MHTCHELEDLVDQYLSDMPARIERLNSSFANCDWEQISRNVHQLKGSAGSYGFPAISIQAERLEQLFADRTTSPEVTAALADLIALCEQAQSTRDATVPAGNAR
jgi:HPt (histidine-containing phosphotransfer) domain-containing protein